MGNPLPHLARKEVTEGNDGTDGGTLKQAKESPPSVRTSCSCADVPHPHFSMALPPHTVVLKPPSALTVKNLGFTMNGVFGDSSTQKDVYEATAAPLVERVLQGFNSTMLAYGQTGSGKTYTMLGGEKAKANLDKELGEEHGIIPRACKQLFAGIKSGQQIKVSYIEVYNDSINDMLCPEYGKEKGQNLPLREVNLNTGGKACVPDGLTLAPAKDAKEVMAHIAKGDTNRVVAAMQMNPRSSRGHGIVALHVVGDDGQTFGRLTLCDLAGMESSKKSAAVDTGPSSLAVRKEEAKRINISLLALSAVVSVLASKGASRVPYRDSKLTRILQDSLGGNCKCAIVVTVRCEKENLEEAINTLRFAQRAAAITVQVMSNADARTNARPKAARLAEELEAARSAMSDFETALAAVEGDKAQLHAEVQALMDEMRLLQRENDRKDQALKDRMAQAELERQGSAKAKVRAACATCVPPVYRARLLTAPTAGPVLAAGEKGGRPARPYADGGRGRLRAGRPQGDRLHWRRHRIRLHEEACARGLVVWRMPRQDWAGPSVLPGRDG